MELIYSMPMIHFKPVEAKKSKGKGLYACPLYMYPLRTGSRERPSFMLPIDLKSGSVEGDFWTKRGTALLLALDAPHQLLGLLLAGVVCVRWDLFEALAKKCFEASLTKKLGTRVTVGAISG